MRKGRLMKVGACALSAVLIMGLYAGPTFAEWVETTGVKRYMVNGQVQTGWQQIDGNWYYLNAQGTPQIGWLQQGNDWYFLAPSGEMVSGVIEVDGKIYYLGAPESGKMETGVVKINGMNFTFEENGEAFGGRKPKVRCDGIYASWHDESAAVCVCV